MIIMIERLVVYNRISERVDEESEKHKYWFLIIDGPREIENKKQLIFENLRPIINLETLRLRVVPKTKSRLKCELIRFETDSFNLDIKNIYKGKLIRDERLDDRIIDIEEYVQNRIS